LQPHALANGRSQAEIDAIVVVARKRNASAQITGGLLLQEISLHNC